MVDTLLELAGFWAVLVAVAVLAGPAWALLTGGVLLLVYVNVPPLLARRRSR